MPKRSFPRELNRRNRRRIYCSRCGNSYSYSGARTHVFPDSSGDEIYRDAPQLLSNGNLCNGDGLETESLINCHEVDEGIDGTEAELIDSPLSPDLRGRLKDRLRKRFSEEDLSYFEGDDEEIEAYESGRNVREDSVNENWCGFPNAQDSEEDFEQNQSTENADEYSPSISDRCGILVFWLLLFLVSWQSAFFVTDSAVEMLLKFLSRFLGLLGTFDENGIISRLSKLCQVRFTS